MTISNIQEHKDKKKYKKIVEELTAVVQLLNLTQEGLKHFKHYIKVTEIISVIETNKQMLDFQKKRYEKELGKLKK